MANKVGKNEIEGLVAHIKTGEFRKFLKDRAAFHKKKGDFFTKKAKEIEPEVDEIDEEADDIGKISNYMSSVTGRGASPVETIKGRALHHKNKAKFFDFMADHLAEGKTYVLSLHDMKTVEASNVE